MFIKGWLPALLLALCLVSGVSAAEPTALTVSDIAFSAGAEIPVAGWVPAPAHQRDINAEARRLGLSPPLFSSSVWVRYRFDRTVAGGGHVAMTSDFMRERYTVYLNGIDLYRTNAGIGDGNLGWHRPAYVPLPDRLLRPGINNLVFRLESADARPLAIGSVSVGPDMAVRALTNRLLFLETTGPEIINGVLALLTGGTLLLWLVRRQEPVFGWLVLVGAVWWFRNLHYYIDSAPFDNALFWTLTTDSIFVLMAVVYGFAATFFALPHRRRVIIAAFSVCGLAIVVRHGLVAYGHADTPSFLLTIPVAVATMYVLALACLRTRQIENMMMLAAVAAATGFGFHDLLLATTGTAGTRFYLQPYGSLLVFSAFGFALGRRLLLALAINENVNEVLAQRITDAASRLARSEATRRALQVANAIEVERERLMREIHDGIGSSLITALAVAEHRQDSPGTIATLKRSITDLRIGVDSLEPIYGDVTLLLASLRHRMERELLAAGIGFVWKVEAVPPLAWLDAVAALHVLRILQEAIGNILDHADARLIDVQCAPARDHGVEGVVIIITDDGRGFDISARRGEGGREGGGGRGGGGRGLSNMAARAEALRAILDCTSAPGKGTRLSLWLPLAN